MKIVNFCSFLLICFIWSFNAFGQIDSLKNTLKKYSKSDSSAYTISYIHERIGRTYEDLYEFDSAYRYYNLQISYVKRNIALAYERDSIMNSAFINLTFASLTDGQNENAIQYADSAILVSKRANMYGQVPRSYNNKAVALNNMSRFEDAIESLTEALQLKDSIYPIDTRRFFHQNVLINIAKNYIDLQNWENAIQYSTEALAAFEKSQRNQAIIYLNLSSVYLEMDKPVEAEYHAMLSDSIATTLGNLPIRINALLNQASSMEKSKNYQSGIITVNKALKLSEEIEFLQGTMLGLGVRANIYMGMERYTESIQDLEESVQLAEKFQDSKYLMSAYESMSDVYSKKRQFTQAYNYYKLYNQLSDSLIGIEKSKNFEELLLKYQTSEKEKQIIQQDLEIKTQQATIADQRNRNILMISGMVVLILIGFLLYNRNKAKQKQKLQLAILAEKEKGFESVINATEQERNRISKDLHDGIGQQLSALKMALNNTTKDLTDEADKEKLTKIATSFAKSADEVRQISHQMMPRALMEDGLVHAIEDLLKNSFQFSDIRYEFEHHQVDARFDEKIEISLYRITQELINNIIKHSKAKNISVQLLNVKDNLVLFVEDDGIGMNENTDKKGHGLLNIKSRLDMVKGSINYEPSIDAGTSVSIKIPYHIV